MLKSFGEKWWEYQVSIFKIDEPNAFAYYGSFDRKAIGVTTGFLKRFNTDELNFAIAHELGHHKHRHHVVTVTTEVISRIGWFVLFYLKFVNPFTVIFNIGFHLFKKVLYRDQEYEADEFAVNALWGAGLTQRGGITFFEKLSRMEEKACSSKFLRKILTVLFSNHPESAKRLERIREMVKF